METNACRLDSFAQIIFQYGKKSASSMTLNNNENGEGNFALSVSCIIRLSVVAWCGQISIPGGNMRWQVIRRGISSCK